MLTLVPNEHWDFGPVDALRGLATVLSSGPGRHLGDIPVPGLGPAIPVRAARAGIVLALRALGLGQGARIGVPLYCCPVVLKAIDAAGCTARFVDVDPSTYCMSVDDLAAKRADLDAVIAVHMFGNVCDVAMMRAVAPGIPVIEDCAQALGACLRERLAGSLGDVAAFSFRSGKYLSVGEGGALYSKQPALQSRLRGLVAELAVPNRLEEGFHVLGTFARSALRSRPFWGLFGERAWGRYGARVSYASQSPVVMTRIYATDWDAAVRRLPKLEELVERQRANAAYYARTLSVDPEMLCAEPTGVIYNRLQFPLLARTPEQATSIVKSLRAHGVSTARPYSSIASVAATHHGYTGDCPQAERVAGSVLVIPCHHALRSTDLERIAACVNLAWQECTRPRHDRAS